MESERVAALRRMVRSWGWSFGGCGVGRRGERSSMKEAWRAVREWWKFGGGELGSGRKARILCARNL